MQTTTTAHTIATAGGPAIRDPALVAALWRIAEAQDRMALASNAVRLAESIKRKARLELAHAEEALNEWRKSADGQRVIERTEMREAA